MNIVLNAPDGKIVKTDVSIAKNYLKQSELDDLGSVVTAVLEFAETEFERYRIIQDRLFRSDFEKMQLESPTLPELPLEGPTE